MEVTLPCSFGLLEAREAGQSIGSNLGFDSHGRPTTDPAAIAAGGAIKNFTG